MKNCVKIVYVIVLLLIAVNINAFAEYPEKPIELICQYGAGGSCDLSLRLLASIASQELGVPINVINKPEGSGVGAYGYLAKAVKPDGYTIGCFAIGSSAIAPRVSKVDFDLKKDFDFIMQLYEGFYSLAVRIDSPWETIEDMAKYARENPGKVTFSSSGVNNHSQFITEALAMELGIELVHVPYQGGMAGATALLGGHVDMASVGENAEFTKNGQFRMLIQYGQERHRDFPDVPTGEDLEIDLSGLNAVFGLVAPKGVPEDRLAKLHDAFKIALEDPKFQELADRFNNVPGYDSGDGFKKTMFEYYDRMGEIMEKLGLIEG